MSELLSTTVVGEGSRPPLLIAHGLFGTGRNWGVLAKRLAEDRRVYTVDMRNHGDSFRADTHSYFDMAGDLAAVIEDAGGEMDVLGHSMGGKAAMILANQRPELVNRLIVADIAPVPYEHDQTDKIGAMRAVDLSVVERRSDADAQLAAMISEPALRAFLLQSLKMGEGSPRWKLNLDVLEREMGKIIGFPDVKGAFLKPTLFLAGGASDYVLPQFAPEMASLFPTHDLHVIPEAGHWLHAEKPREFERAVADFLAR